MSNEPQHEVVCPNCEATIRARMADAPAPLSAVQYAGLVGRYIRMERDITEPERAFLGDDETVGMECVVERVQDLPDGFVGIYSDEGMTFALAPGIPWRFTIWTDEDAAKASR